MVAVGKPQLILDQEEADVDTISEIENLEPKMEMKLPKNGQNLASLYPEIAGEWDFELNDLGPDCYFPRSNKTVNWICQLGHRWPAKINNRTTRGSQCPCCSGSKPICGVNDLETLFPHLAQEWDYTKNDRPPSDFLPKSNNRDYFWLCEHGHSWQASPANRNKGTKCPYCAGKKPIVGVNDLESVLPQIALEWHPTRNGDALPEHYLPNSHFEAWWQCASGHEWQKAIYERAYGSNCPVCNKLKTPIRRHI